MQYKKPVIPLTEEQKGLINEYYKQYGEKHLISCINKVTKGKAKGEILNDYIGIAEEAVCKAAKNYIYGRGMEFPSWVEKNVKSSICTRLRDANTQKRRPECIESLDKELFETESGTTIHLGEAIPVKKKQDDNTYETVVKYMRQLSGDEKIMVYLRSQGADFEDISEAFHMNINSVKDKFKKISSYEHTKVFNKRRIYH